MRQTLASLCVFLTILTAGTARAGDNPVLIELFTSQGCSSCPPADALLRKLEAREDVIALAYHVDYWDYIGWKDAFARPEFGERQRDYVRRMGTRRYTPHMIIGGQAQVAGTQPMKVMNNVTAQAEQADVALQLNRTGGKLSIRAPRVNGLSKPLMVQIVRFDPSRTVKILRGENRGRTLSYTNVVTSIEVIGHWNGRTPLAISHTVSGNDGIVVILQSPGPGDVIAVAALP